MVLCLRQENDPNFHDVSISDLEAQLINENPSESQQKWPPRVDRVCTSHSCTGSLQDLQKKNHLSTLYVRKLYTRQVGTGPRSQLKHSNRWGENLPPGLSAFKQHLEPHVAYYSAEIVFPLCVNGLWGFSVT